MNGRLFLRDGKWYVEYQVINSVRSLPLHKDSVRQLSLRSDKKPEQMIGDKIEFEIVKEYIDSNTNQVQNYAKLTQCNGLDLTPSKSNINTTPETSKLVVGSKVTSHYVMTKEMEHELDRVFDNVQARFMHEVVQRFTDEMLASRLKDVKIEEGTKFFDDTRYTLELFVFNKEELSALIQAVKEGR